MAAGCAQLSANGILTRAGLWELQGAVLAVERFRGKTETPQAEPSAGQAPPGWASSTGANVRTSGVTPPGSLDAGGQPSALTQGAPTEEHKKEWKSKYLLD